MIEPRTTAPASSGSNAIDAALVGMEEALGLNGAGDSVESYFECITTCSLDDGACITQCVEQLRMHH